MGGWVGGEGEEEEKEEKEEECMHVDGCREDGRRDKKKNNNKNA